MHAKSQYRNTHQWHNLNQCDTVILSLVAAALEIWNCPNPCAPSLTAPFACGVSQITLQQTAPKLLRKNHRATNGT